MNDTAKGDGGLDIDALAAKVVDQLAGRLAGSKAVIVNQPPTNAGGREARDRH
jgi:hypothetical protein